MRTKWTFGIVIAIFLAAGIVAQTKQAPSTISTNRD